MSIGHHPTNRYFHRLDKNREPGCRLCGIAEETVTHLLTEFSVAIGDADESDRPPTVEEYLHGDVLMLRLDVGIVGRAIRV